MNPHASSVDGRRRGSVIVLVLALITLAAFFLSQFIERSMTEMLVETRARQAERLRADAHAALETSLAVLADYQAVDEALRSPAQGWGDPLAGLELEPREGTTVAVRIEDESGRISLPRLGLVELVKLGEQLGLKEADAARLADALLTWTRRDHASTRYETDPRRYEYEEPPHRPPGRALGSFDELSAVAVARELFFTAEGEPTELYDDFVASVSLYDFPAINLNSAQPQALELAGLDATQIARITAYAQPDEPADPREPAYFKTLAEAQTLLGATVPLTGFDTRAQCFRVHVTVGEGATTFRLTAVVVPATGSAGQGEATGRTTSEETGFRYPFRLLAFEENIQLEAAPTL